MMETKEKTYQFDDEQMDRFNQLANSASDLLASIKSVMPSQETEYVEQGVTMIRGTLINISEAAEWVRDDINELADLCLCMTYEDDRT